jgi:hypothetical protein
MMGQPWLGNERLCRGVGPRTTANVTQDVPSEAARDILFCGDKGLRNGAGFHHWVV